MYENEKQPNQALAIVESEALNYLSNYDGVARPINNRNNRNPPPRYAKPYVKIGRNEIPNLVGGQRSREMSFTLTNSHPTAVQTCILMPGLAKLDALGGNPIGTIIDGNFASKEDTGATKSLTSRSQSPFGTTINFFRNYCKARPTYLKSIHITAETEAASNGIVFFTEEQTPYGVKNQGALTTGTYSSSDNANGKVKTIEASMLLNEFVSLTISLAPNSVQTITLRMGHEFDPAKLVY
jgi:hypothetical protein